MSNNKGSLGLFVDGNDRRRVGVLLKSSIEKSQMMIGICPFSANYSDPLAENTAARIRVVDDGAYSANWIFESAINTARYLPHMSVTKWCYIATLQKTTHISPF